MNRTIISIEVQDHGDKEATIIVRGERNSQIMFEEAFSYKDEKKHSLRLHLLKERFIKTFPKLGESLGIICIRKLFNDITIRSKIKANSDYRDKRIIKKSIYLHGRKEIEDFFKEEFTEKEELNKYVTQLLQYPDGASFGLPSHYSIDGNQIVVNRKSQEVVIFHS